jgi:hypothetical protein
MPGSMTATTAHAAVIDCRLRLTMANPIQVKLIGNTRSRFDSSAVDGYAQAGAER